MADNRGSPHQRDTGPGGVMGGVGTGFKLAFMRPILLGHVAVVLKDCDMLKPRHSPHKPLAVATRQHLGFAHM